jgi:hypothetical protein
MVAGSCLLLAISRFWAWGSALLAGVLSFASPKESSQRKGDPKVGAPSGFLALLGEPGGCGTRATPSNSPRRRPPARLRCSAPLMGARKASTGNRFAEKIDSYGQPGKTAKNEISWSFVDASLLPLTRGRPGGGWFPGPLEGAEQRRVWRIKGEDCLRAKPEFRSPRQPRVAQGTGAAGTAPGSPFLCLLSFGEAKESETPRKGGTSCQYGTPSQSKPQASASQP